MRREERIQEELLLDSFFHNEGFSEGEESNVSEDEECSPATSWTTTLLSSVVKIVSTFSAQPVMVITRLLRSGQLVVSDYDCTETSVFYSEAVQEPFFNLVPCS